MDEENKTVDQETTERTFTQSELDAIVSDRLKRERSKYEGFEELKAKASKYDEMEEASKSELQKATERANALEAQLNDMKKADEIRTMRSKVSTDTGIPANLLTGSTEEECKEQAQAILSFANPKSYPSVKDGGEVSRVSPGANRDKFAEWFANSADIH